MKRGTLISVVLLVSVGVALGILWERWRDATENPRSTELLEKARSDLAEAHRAFDEILDVQETRTEANTLAPYNRVRILMMTAKYRAGKVPKEVLDEPSGPAAEYRSARDTLQETLSDHQSDLYRAVSAVAESTLDAETERFRRVTLDDLRRSGAELSRSDQKRLRRLFAEIEEVGLQFVRNKRKEAVIEVDSLDELQGLPEDFVGRHATGSSNEPICLSTGYRDFLPVMMYADNAVLRRRMVRAWANVAYPENKQVLHLMLEKRHQAAQLLGYPSWTAYATENTMAGSPDGVKEFIDEIAEIFQQQAERDMALLLEQKRRDVPDATHVDISEKWYYENRLKRQLYGFDERQVRNYFRADRVVDGVRDVAARVFDLRFEKNDDQTQADPTIEVYDVYVATSSSPIGRICLDLFWRDGKSSYTHPLLACAADDLLPEARVCMMLPRSTGDVPPLLDHKLVESLFHEFGHALNLVLGGHAHWHRFVGTALEPEFHEVPALLFEEWAWDPNVLAIFALHHRTNEPIPSELVHRMQKARKASLAADRMCALPYVAMALHFHDGDPATFDVDELQRELTRKFSPFSADGTFTHTRFESLQNKSSNHYTYFWAAVIAFDLLEQFRDDSSELDLLDTEKGRRLRDTLLAPGGSKKAARLIEDFLGRPPSSEAYRRWAKSFP